MCNGRHQHKPKSVQTRLAASIPINSSSKTEDSSPAPLNNYDYTQPRREFAFDLPDFVRFWITKTFLRQQDERNLPILLVGLNILVTSCPVVLSIFVVEHYGLLSKPALFCLGTAYAVVHLKMWARSFLLALHYITHCSIFNRQFRFMDQLFSTFLVFFFGIPPGSYYPHHVAMHHSEDNVAPHDMSSTMDYNRASKWNHFMYMLRFVILGNFELPYRLIQMNKFKLACQTVIGALVYYGTMVTLFSRFPVATSSTMALPTVIVGFGLMQGNFKEHIFVDPEDYENNYKSAFSCINAPSNALTFNTGYHIEHHEEPGLPWFKLPDLFLKNIGKHAANDSLTFSGIGSMEVGTLVLEGKFDTLADHYINVGQPQRTKAELIQEFKRRLVPIHASRTGTQ